jgi:hypothetical protein
MIKKIEKTDELNYSIGQKWLNTNNGTEFYIVDIDDTLITIDDRKGKLSSFEHMNKTLRKHLVKIGVFKQTN